MSRVGASEKLMSMSSKMPTAHRRRRIRPRLMMALAAFGLCGSLTSCATPVAVAPSQSEEPQCKALIDSLPDRVDNQERRTVQPDSGSTAAWGDPPIVLRCGVGTPTGLRPDSALTQINGIDWFAEERSRGFVFTTVGRTPSVEVTVPDAYAPEGNILAELSPVFRSQTLPGD